jgi:hypothetical protein
MSNGIPQIVPVSQGEVQEAFASAKVTRDFYEEVQVRSDFQRYCGWYRSVAEQNRQDLEKMRGEINFFRFFRGNR